MRAELHPAFPVIGPCAADAGFAVPEVEILNLQGEHFVNAHAGVSEESHQQFDFRHGEEHHVLVLGHNLRYGDQLGRVLRIHLLVMAYSNTAAMTTLTMLCRDSAARLLLAGQLGLIPALGEFVHP